MFFSIILLPLFILLIPWGIARSATNPQPTQVRPEDRLSNDVSLIVRFVVPVFKAYSWVHATIEVLLVVANSVKSTFPQTIVSRYAGSIIHTLALDRKGGNIVFFPPLRVVGGVLILVGAGIRLLCYRELGKYFTFYITIMKDHELVTTGPYAIVRHPSYTGAAMQGLGSLLWHGTSGAWLVESGVYSYKAMWPILVAMAVMHVFLFVFGVRAIKEDKLLEQKFGKKWNAWADKVPWRFIPGVL